MKKKKADFVYLTIDGVKGTLAYWARFYNMEYSLFRSRYLAGMRGDALFAKKYQTRNVRKTD